MAVVVKVPIPKDASCCAAEAIRGAIAPYQGQSNVAVQLEAGVYNCKNPSSKGNKNAMIHFWHCQRWTLVGAKDCSGDPLTTLQINFELANEITGARHLDIRNCTNFTLENIVLDLSPRMATAGVILSIEANNNVTTIEIFDGMPHFDGMACCSANNWDLSSKTLIQGPPLTIGTDARAFGAWRKAPGSPKRYSIFNTWIAAKAKVGQGISFHFNINCPQGRAIDLYECKSTLFQNVFCHNAIGMVMGAGDNRDITFKRFHVKPEGNSLAVGPRDGIHMSRCGGELLMDDVVVKGVRWDPIVCYMNFCQILERVSETAVQLDCKNDAKARWLVRAVKGGSKIHFWTGTDPSIRQVASVTDEGLLEFTNPLHSSVTKRGIITPESWHWEKATITNCTIESNYGTALVFESDNLLVENCAFHNNSYSSIALGPSGEGSGMFCRNIVIRNNNFSSSTWCPKYKNNYLDEQRGTITMLKHCSLFSSKQSYHRNITVQNNVFKDLRGTNNPAAVDVKLVKNVTVQHNEYDNVAREVLVDPSTTENVTIDERS